MKLIIIQRSMEDALALASELDSPIWVVGGTELYKEAVLHEKAKELRVTVVDKIADASNIYEKVRLMINGNNIKAAFFPEQVEWGKGWVANHGGDDQERVENGCKFRFLTYSR